ncbi:MAG: deoxynucleoside kinase [Nanoarchaeota archaeon]
MLISNPSDRIIHLSGIHGGGKSTLIKRLAEDGFIYHNRQHPGEGLQNPLERHIRRAQRLWEDHQLEIEIATNNPDKIVLGDRCRYDYDSYSAGFHKIGWLTPEEKEIVRKTIDSYFKDIDNPRHIIFIDPPLEWVKERIQERWKMTGRVKWRENDFRYLEASYNSFKEVYANARCDVLTLTETNLEKRVKICADWIDTIRIRLENRGETPLYQPDLAICRD